MLSAGRGRDFSENRPLTQRAQFAPHVMVSAGLFSRQAALVLWYFVGKKSKVSAHYYVYQLLKKLVDDCHHLCGQQFIFQQDGLPVHAA